MVELQINISSGNAAFEDDPVGELQRILRNVADRLPSTEGSNPIRDLNGNKIGDLFVSVGGDE
jgi:hypothetical protein